MPTNKKHLLLIACICSASMVYGQLSDSNTMVQFHEYSLQYRNTDYPCLTAATYTTIAQQCRAHDLMVGNTHIAQKTNLEVAFSWPLKLIASVEDCSFYFVAAYVDEDSNPSSFYDYNCGSITYDGHNGTDIAIEPFPFYKMDNNQVMVIAAANGNIVDKHDGEYDKNCVGSGSGLTANYIVLEHADGSHTIYAHMKKNSLTSKIVGESVESGEYLGIVGSSGSSSGPHLHFEVWSGNSSATVVDPYAGTCNQFNPSSLWAVQKPYTEPAVVKASVHTTDIVFPDCPDTEIPNESSSYEIPFQGEGLAPGYAKFYVFMRNLNAGDLLEMKILNPDQSVFNSWNYTLPASYPFSYAGFSKLLPVINGTYSFQASYNGVVCMQYFDIINTTGFSELIEDPYGIYSNPNPFDATCRVVWNGELQSGTLYLFSMQGTLIKTICEISGSSITLAGDDLPEGLYLLQLLDHGKIIGTRRIMAMH